jgi:hypothetical protein
MHKVSGNMVYILLATFSTVMPRAAAISARAAAAAAAAAALVNCADSPVVRSINTIISQQQTVVYGNLQHQ